MLGLLAPAAHRVLVAAPLSSLLSAGWQRTTSAALCPRTSPASSTSLDPDDHEQQPHTTGLLWGATLASTSTAAAAASSRTGAVARPPRLPISSGSCYTHAAPSATPLLCSCYSPGLAGHPCRPHQHHRDPPYHGNAGPFPGHGPWGLQRALSATATATASQGDTAFTANLFDDERRESCAAGPGGAGSSRQGWRQPGGKEGRASDGAPLSWCND